MKIADIDKETYSKFEKIHKRGVRKMKRKKIFYYLIYMLFLGILTVLVIGDVIPLPYFLKRVFLIGFIFGILYPIYAWIRNVVSWNK